MIPKHPRIRLAQDGLLLLFEGLWALTGWIVRVKERHWPRREPWDEPLEWESKRKR